MKKTLAILIRDLVRQKAFTGITTVGLAIGVACCMLILLFVRDELNYDRFHANANRLFRIVSENSVVTPGTISDVLREEIPDVEKVTRLYTGKLWGRSVLLSSNQAQSYSDDFFLADPNVFDVFSFHFVAGNPATFLKDPTSAVITKKTASFYFGTDDPIGKTIVVENKYSFHVNGVIDDIPSNSHVHFDMLVPLDFYRTWRESPDGPEQWYNHAFLTYALLREGANAEQIEALLPQAMKKYAGPDYDFRYRLQPIADIHLFSHLRREVEANSDVRYVYFFSTLALLILAIAAVNFANLSTARSKARGRAIGIRKILGANRSHIAFHFLKESGLIAACAILVAFFLAELALPFFNTLTGKTISLSDISLGESVLMILGFMVATGVLAGIYPAWFFSRFEASGILRGGTFTGGQSNTLLRRILVVGQFVVAIGLVACTFIVRNQMAYTQEKNLGISTNQVVVISTRRSEDAVDKVPALKEELARYSDVISVSSSSQTPGRGLFRRVIKRTGSSDNESTRILSLWVDEDFLKTYKIGLKAGRNFQKDRPGDAINAFLLNETAAGEMGFDHSEDAIGTNVTIDDKTGTIVGVVKDFNFMSLHSKIDPIVLHIDPTRYSYVSVRVQGARIRQTVQFLEETWRSLLPERPFEYFFADADYGRQYRAEERLESVFLVFSVLAISVACLGLLGLALLITEQRTKEIGIRKVLGASMANLLIHLCGEFAVLAIAANILAFPMAYFGMNRWLEDFAYRASIAWWIFPVSGTLALFVALVTIGLLAMKSARLNPADALRYE